MLNVWCHLRRLARPFAILVIALLGLLLPTTAAVSLTQSARAPAAAVAEMRDRVGINVPGRPTGIFAPVKARSGERNYHYPSLEADEGKASGVSGTVGIWLLAGLSLLLLAAGLAPRSTRRKPCARRRCGAC